MHTVKITSAKWWALLPLAGSALFVVLYFFAAMFYPGGSQADSHASGFSWLHNYWCNLLGEKAINNQTNTGRPFALAAMTVLALTLFGFWVVSVRRLRFSKKGRFVLLLSGFISMAFLPFLSSSAHHDAVINGAASFGLISMVMIYAALYKSGRRILFYFGLLNLGLVLLNNYVYHFSGSLYWLPLVQKITFASFLLWVCAVTVALANTSQTEA